MLDYDRLFSPLFDKSESYLEVIIFYAGIYLITKKF